jgi:hypothetical protein
MTNNPFAEFDLEQAIGLRWTLRDIRGRRWKLSPVDRGHLKTLVEMGYVEMQDGEPTLTNAGLDVII